MATNTILTIQDITREALDVLHSKLVYCKTINREYDSRFAKTGAKIGETLQIRLPQQYTVRSGRVMNVQDSTDTKVDLVVSDQRGVDLSFSASDRLMSLDQFRENHLNSAMSRLAAELDFLCMQDAYRDTWNQVGAPGTTPAAALVWLQAGQKLDEYLCPSDDMRFTCMDPAAQAATVNGLTGLFQDSTLIAKQYRRGRMGMGLGFDHAMSQNVNKHTVGTDAGTPLTNGAGQTGASLITDGWTNSTAALKQGDIFTIAGVNGVNPETKQDLGTLQQFVATADGTADGSGNLTIAISPTITLTGAYQTVAALPGDGAAIVVAGTGLATYPINMAYHKDSFTLVTADLEIPRGQHEAYRAQKDGISMRVVTGYDIVNDLFPTRVDIFFGKKLIRPELSCRVIG